MSKAVSLELQYRFGAAEAGLCVGPASQTEAAQVAGYRLVLATDPAQLSHDWLALEASPSASVFQSYRWCEAWSRLVAPGIGERPFIVAGYDSADGIAFVLPLSLNRRRGFTILTWLGQSHANYNLAIWRADLQAGISPATARAVLEWAARQAKADAACLTDQPGIWRGAPNPFVTAASTPATSNSYALDLDGDFASLYARKFGNKTRASLKRKDRRLQEIAPVVVEHQTETAARLAHMDEYFRQKALQFAEQGIANIFADLALQRFYRDLAAADDHAAGVESSPASPTLSLMRLMVGSQVAATFNGIRFGDRFYLLTLSLTDDPAIRRCSPGQRLMREQIAHCYADGVSIYDFGTGEGDHKSAWDAVPVPLWDSLVPFNNKGRAYCQALAAKRKVKRWVKTSPRLWALVRKGRRLRAALPRAGKAAD